MTRKTTWSNSDGLVVGFGPNVPDRDGSCDSRFPLGVLVSEGHACRRNFESCQSIPDFKRN